MSAQKQVQFSVPTTNTDGSAINEPLNYVVFLDTVSPPVKSFPVPAANVAAAVNGLVTVTFAQLGFTPVNGQAYFADVEAIDASGTSAPSNIASFTYTVVPSAPTGFLVS